jgi:prevent-host-death family protein
MTLIRQQDGKRDQGRDADSDLEQALELASHTCYATSMAKVITQRTLRNDSGEIMRGLDRGESYIVTRNGVPVGELVPVRRRVAVPAAMLVAALAGAPRIDPTRFRKDIDEVINQDPRPRA